MTFQATIYSVKVDAEGEGTLVLKVPSSDLEKVIGLAKQTEQVLNVSIV